MKKNFVFLIFLLFSLLHCTKNSGKSTVNKVTYGPLLKDSFFLTDNWSYRSFTVKIGEGKFDFTDGVKDTSHLYHTANIFHFPDLYDHLGAR